MIILLSEYSLKCFIEIFPNEYKNHKKRCLQIWLLIVYQIPSYKTEKSILNPNLPLPFNEARNVVTLHSTSNSVSHFLPELMNYLCMLLCFSPFNCCTHNRIFSDTTFQFSLNKKLSIYRVSQKKAL